MRRRIREGLRSGIVGAAATAGALVALGRAHGAALRPLNAVAHIAIGSRAYFLETLDLLVTPMAIALHVASVALWGVVFSLLSPRLRGPKLYPAALAFAAGTWVIDYRIVPDRLRPGFESGLSGIEIGFVYLVLALSLAWALRRERESASL